MWSPGEEAGWGVQERSPGCGVKERRLDGESRGGAPGGWGVQRRSPGWMGSPEEEPWMDGESGKAPQMDGESRGGVQGKEPRMGGPEP